MQMNPSTGLSIVATLASLGVTAFAWRRRKMAGARPLATFTGATAVWTGGNALQAASTTLVNKLFWVDVQYVGIAAVPLAWFAFACEYTDRGEWADRRTLAFLSVPLVVLILLSWTNGSHHLVRASSEVVVQRGNAALERTFGPAFWAGWMYSNLLTGFGTTLLLYNLLRVREIFRRQTFAILGGATVPWVASGMFYNGLLSLEPEVFFSVSGVAFAYAIAEYDLLDIVPVGRSVVVEQMDDGVLVLDGDDRVVDANPAASRMFGVTDAKSMVGRPITEIDIPDAELLGRSEDDQTTNVIAVNGTSETQQYVNVRRSSLSDAGSSEPGTVLLLRDVTELKRQAARLERKNERLERVGQTIAHDLWNPLNVAQGRLELAAETGDHEHLDEVENAHDRMGEIIEEILDMARNEQVAGRKRVGLPNVAEAAWANVETGGVDLKFDDCGVSVLADESELTSAFENLFRNAVEHGSTDSRPSANDTVEHSESELTIRVGGLDGEPGFYVEDDGRGIPEHERQEVFEAGYTTHEDGSGVGLTVVGDVAERHGWTVEVTESDAGGARFEFRGVETERAPTPTQ